MRSLKGWIGAAGVAFLVVAVLAAPVLAASSVTVGRFVQELAKAKGLNATDGRIAVDSLKGAGVNVPANLDLSRALTQKDVAELAGLAGIRVTTSDPGATFTDEQMSRFFRSFGSELGAVDATAVTQGTFDPWTKGQKKGSGKAKYNRSPIEPE